jgi:hypothetical protein
MLKQAAKHVLNLGTGEVVRSFPLLLLFGWLFPLCLKHILAVHCFVQAPSVWTLALLRPLTRVIKRPDSFL